jgi:hypothetical protein
MFSNPLVEKLAAFVRHIGIDVQAATLPEPTVLPGLDIRYGAVLVDESRLLNPGDVLHEAGHIAVSDPAVRRQPRLSPTGGEELSTIAWTFAAARHLGLAIELFFHERNFQGEGAALAENFNEGRYIGVPLLQLHGMTVDPGMTAARGVAPFPHMLRWLR